MKFRSILICHERLRAKPVQWSLCRHPSPLRSVKATEAEADMLPTPLKINLHVGLCNFTFKWLWSSRETIDSYPATAKRSGLNAALGFPLTLPTNKNCVPPATHSLREESSWCEPNTERQGQLIEAGRGTGGVNCQAGVGWVARSGGGAGGAVKGLPDVSGLSSHLHLRTAGQAESVCLLWCQTALQRPPHCGDETRNKRGKKCVIAHVAEGS